ncbi:MAG: DUF4105 domain-containing protein [Candidatus Poseidoniaceae archaeon]|nr:DUF4105 domain-containing protein [Candidatus Poseidoniaceae archaeon]
MAGVIDVLCGVGLSVAGLLLLSVLLWVIRIRPRVPKLDDTWNSDCERTTTADITGSTIRFSNIRDFFWRTTRDRDEDWEDTLEVDADQIKDVWFVVDHFHHLHGMAHTFLTFEFNNGTCLSFSFEARRRKGQRYHPWPGLWRHYELYLLVGHERDLLGLRTNGRGNKDYMFRGITPPGKEKALLLALTNKANSLAEKGEWYHSFLTTCNTSIVGMVNRITPGRVPFTWRNFLPGYTPRAAYKLGLIEKWGDFETTIERARVDEHAMQWDGEGTYSQMIRDYLPKGPL